MRALVQRVSEAAVTVDSTVVGQIGNGLLVLLGVRSNDTVAQAIQLAAKVSGLRIFHDEAGKMNRNVQEVAGEILVVSQFTLYADTQKGHRPSYSDAAPAVLAKPLYEAFVKSCRETGLPVATGIFGAHMKVRLTNDGPVTILCEIDHPML
jgi:D-tyrosyl-tRNA(Tyr) deacylase